MSPFTTTCELYVADAHAALKAYLDRFERHKPGSRSASIYQILDGLEFLQQKPGHMPGRLLLSKHLLMKWIQHRAQTRTFDTAASSVRELDDFMQYLYERKIIPVNPMELILREFGKRKWSGIVRAFQSGAPETALETLRVEPGFTGTFGEHADTFVRLHRTAGQPFIFNRYLLIAFNRFIRKQGSDDVESVTPDVVKQWISTLTCSHGMRRQRLRMLRQFFEHLCNLQVIKVSPVPWSLIDSYGRVDRTFRPYIFTEPQMQALLAAAKRLPRIRLFPLCPDVMHMAIATLYILGLRLNEALNLRLADIDEKQQTLFIRQAKFHKERYVPYGPRFAECLRSYLEARRADGVSTAGESPLFVRWSDQPLTAGTFRRHYVEAMRDAGIIPGEGPKPRIHDIRHAFAVHRLLRWYREGVDVQKRLVLLSTFMGHVSIYSTQVYLTITGSLLGEANKRFLNAFGSVAEGGEPSKP